jgi:hypothetical protein
MIEATPWFSLLFSPFCSFIMVALLIGEYVDYF